MSSSDMIRTLVIDDEESARNDLKEMLVDTETFDVVDTANSLESAIQVIKENNCDLVFLDYKLLGGTAFQVIDGLIADKISIPPIILNTGRNDLDIGSKAINEYSSHILQLWQKPIFTDWDTKIAEVTFHVNELRRIKENKYSSYKHNNYTFQIGTEYYSIPYDMIYFVTVGDKGSGKVRLMYTDGQKEINKSLSLIYEDLKDHGFIRIHRSTIINLKYLFAMRPTEDFVELRGVAERLTIGESYKKSLKQILS